jgi:hypothetical protein
MPYPEKSSRAEVRSFRFNPIHIEEARVLAIFDELEANGQSVKNRMIDAVLRFEGYEPEMFAHPENEQADRIAALVSAKLLEANAELVQQIINQIKSSGVRLDKPEYDVDDEGGVTSQFARNFAASFAQRQGISLSDEDE